MRGWLLDTNVIASLSAANGDPSVKAWADPSRARYAAGRAAIARRFGERVLPLSNAAVLRWGALAGRIKRDTGRPPAVVDTLLAATAIEVGLYFVTRNTKDVRHSGAAVFNPWEDDPQDFRLLGHPG